MDQVKIGKFIAARRRKANFTQMQLAEKPGITDRVPFVWTETLSVTDPRLV